MITTNYSLVLRAGTEAVERYLTAKNYNDALGKALETAHKLTLEKGSSFNIARLDVA